MLPSNLEERDSQIRMTPISTRGHTFGLTNIAIAAFAVAVLLASTGSPGAQPADPGAYGPYAWRHTSPATVDDRIVGRITPPAGFERVPAKADSFAHWLRGLPLKPKNAPVLLFTGAHKSRQDVHVAVVDIDVGKRDLQQCADAVMRLRAEWLWSIDQKSKIAFNYTGGGRVPFSRWARGERPSQSGKRWSRRGKRDASYASFKKYMIQIFAYAGTYSLSRELKPIDPGNLRAGDVFIKGGFPGHAVLVADVAVNPQSGEKRFLLLQSYMPAQEIHILKNPANADGSPWYSSNFSWPLATPEWTFPMGSLKRWP